MMLRRLFYLLAIAMGLLMLAGCGGQASLPGPAAPPPIDAPGEDGLPAPAGTDMLSGNQPPLEPPSGFAALAVPEEAMKYYDPASKLLGLDALTEGTLLAWESDAMPRCSVRYGLPASKDSLIGSLAVAPQSSKIARWLGHPAIAGYVYTNNLLATVDSLDTFLTSETVTEQVQLSGALGGRDGVASLLQDFYQVGFKDDFGTWWDGELLMVWVPVESTLRPVWIFSLTNPTVAADKARQMLAMYFFYQHTDRGIFTPERIASGVTIHRLARYDGTNAPLDLAYAVDGSQLILGGAAPLSTLLDKSAPEASIDPAENFRWDAAMLNSTPRSFALGFRGGDQAQTIMSGFFERGVGILPGGGRDAAGAMGQFFNGEGMQRVIVDIVPGRFQWWLMGSNGKDYQSASRLWTTGQNLAVVGLAQNRSWDRDRVRAEEAEMVEEVRDQLPGSRAAEGHDDDFMGFD